MLTLELVVTAVVKTVVTAVVTALLSLVLVVRALVALDVFDGGICIFRGRSELLCQCNCHADSSQKRFENLGWGGIALFPAPLPLMS